MQCLTEPEASAWLRQRTIPEDPYHRDERPPFYLQFHAPSPHRHTDAWVRQYWKRIIPGADAMVYMTDWGLYEQSEMIAVMGIRNSQGESRPLIEAPAHAVTAEACETGIGLFSLAVSFEWSSYLYSPMNRSTLYNWEGDILDFWTDSEEALAEMRRLVEEFGLGLNTP